MTVEFRQRTPSEYVKIALKRKWLILLPTIAIATAVGWVVYHLADAYESTTLIVVKPSTLPTSVVPTVTEDNLTRQLTSIAQVVTSRSSLEPLIQKYDLYKIERLRGVPMEFLVDGMRKDIKVEVNTTRNDVTNGFNITYRGRDPRTTQALTAELASKYVDEQTKNTISSSAAAKLFIEQQVKLAKDELDKIDKQRLEFMQRNLNNLPSGAASLVAQLTGLRESQKAYIAEIGRQQDRRSALASQLTLIKKQAEQTREDVAENTTDPKTTLAWAELVKRKADLEAQLQHMLTELRPKHPDVQAKQAELNSVKEQMDEIVTDWRAKIKEKEDKLKARPDLSAAGLESEVKLIEGQMKRDQQLLEDAEKQIADILKRINDVPGAEVSLGALDREYQTKKANYDQLLGQQAKIEIGANAASQQQGETIQVIDPANLPSLPVAPKRFLLGVIGLVLGLGVGLLLAGAVEIPKLFTIQTSEDATHYTELPVLVSVPEMLTPQEARNLPRRRKLALAAGVVATLVSIPTLALGLKVSHLLERFLA